MTGTSKLVMNAEMLHEVEAIETGRKMREFWKKRNEELKKKTNPDMKPKPLSTLATDVYL